MNNLRRWQAEASMRTNAPQPAIAIPDHHLLRCIGQGSYGEVWLAQNMMGMYRAVKVVYRRSFKDQRPFERELSGIRKFEPISRSYEGFIDVLHIGMNEEQGYFYYVMELGDDEISGQSVDPQRYVPKTLAKEIGPCGRLPAPDCLQFGLALSHALAELHKHGLVHRDVKPSNIIFVNGVPKLADIGLVAEASEARSYVGTEGFIPPEGPGTAQADVYGLGKVLYEACTGKDRQDFPELPQDWDRFSDHQQFLELNDVILRACKNDITERYQSAADMHADLVVLANGKSVKRLKLLERRLSNLKRIGGLSVLAVAVLATVCYPVYREWRSMIESRQRQVGANLARGNAAMEAGDLPGALPYFADALRLENGNNREEATHRSRFGAVLAQCPKLTHLWVEKMQVDDCEFGPADKTILIAQFFFGKAEIYNLETRKLYSRPFGQEQGLVRAAYSPDGRFVVTASEDSTAVIWDAMTLERVRSLPHTNRVYSARYSSDGHRIVTGCYDGNSYVWNATNGERGLCLRGHTKEVRFAAFSNDGILIVTGSADGTARLWNATTGQCVQVLPHRTWVNYAAFSPDDKKVITACADHKARLWKVSNGERILPDLNHHDVVKSAEFSPDGRLIVTASWDGAARLWSAIDLQPVGSNPILRHSDRVTHASFSGDSRRIVTSCTDGSVRVWDLAGSRATPRSGRYIFSQDASTFLTVTNNKIQIWDSMSGKTVSSVQLNAKLEKSQFNRNGRFLVSISKPASSTSDREIEIWNSATGEQIGASLTTSNLTKAALSDDGKRLAIFSGKTARVWDVASRTPIAPLLFHDDLISSAFFKHDGTCIGTSDGSLITVWDLPKGNKVFPSLKPPSGLAFSHAEFSPDGALLVTCCSNDQPDKGFAQIWDAISGRPKPFKLNHGDGVLFASFSPDSRQVVTASEDFTAIIWDVATGRHLPALQHEHQVQTAVFSPDGKRVVTASTDKTARVWSAETGAPLTPPLRHLTPLFSAQFLPDGHRIVTGDQKGNAWTWSLSSDERPLGDLILLSQLLSSGTVTSEHLVAAPAESIKTIWERLRAAYPTDFSTTDQEIASWHRAQAEESEIDEQWSAAVFHWQKLLALNPSDSSLIQRLASARDHCKPNK